MVWKKIWMQFENRWYYFGVLLKGKTVIFAAINQFLLRLSKSVIHTYQFWLPTVLGRGYIFTTHCAWAMLHLFFWWLQMAFFLNSTLFNYTQYNEDIKQLRSSFLLFQQDKVTFGAGIKIMWEEQLVDPQII